MIDEKPAVAMGKVFKILAKNRTDENKALAKEIFEMCPNHGFNVRQMDADDALIDLGVAFIGEAVEASDDQIMQQDVVYSNEW